MAQDTPQSAPNFDGLRYIPIDQDPSFDPSKQQSNPKDIVSSEPVQLKPSTNKPLPSAVQPLPTPKDLYNTTVEGAKQAAQATQDIGQGPSSGSTTAEQIHDLTTGAVKAGTVPLMFAAAVDPMLLGQGLLETTAAQKTGEGVATMAGASPDTAQAVGDVAAFAIPSVIHGLPARPEGSAFLPGGETGAVKIGGDPFDFSGLRMVEEPTAPKPTEEVREPAKPKERTTGDEELDKRIKDAGGVPGGVQKGFDYVDKKTGQPAHYPDMAYVHHDSGSTLNFPMDATTEDIKGGLDSKTAEYKAAADKKVAENQKALTEGMNAFNKSEGRPEVNPAHVKEDPRASQMADAYKAAEHNPNDPAVKKSYDALKADVDKQYELAEKLGIKMDVKDENPYKGDEDLHNDVLNNKHLSVWSGGAPPADHPLSAIDPKTGLTYNDKFRMVHDIFGHAAHKTDFSPAGEESAWNFHNQMFSPEARPALATETRGQAAYTYKYGDFPPQKAAILPEEFHNHTEPDWSDQAAKSKDGFSFRPATGEAPKSGYMVESHPEARQVLDHPATAEDIRNFAAKNKELLDKHPELHVGGYENELNIASNIQDKDAAVRMAKTLDQKSIYDVKKQDVFDTKGEGQRTSFPNYSSDERMSDVRGDTKMGPAGWEHMPKTLHDALQPDEKKFMSGNKTLQQNVTNSYRGIKASLPEIINSMKAGAGNAGWWQRFIDTFETAGGSARISENGPKISEVLKQMHSAVSGNKNVEDAQRLAGHFFTDWMDQGQPKDRASIDALVKKWGADAANRTYVNEAGETVPYKGNAAMSDSTYKKGPKKGQPSAGMDTQKLFQLINSPEMRGERPFSGAAIGDNPLAGVSSGAIKIPSMGALTAEKGNFNRTVMDAHGLDIYGQKGWTDASYIAHSIHMRQAAESIGLKGGEGQEQQWGVILGLKYLMAQGMAPEAAAQHIVDNPDFVTKFGKDYAAIMLKDPETHNILTEMEKYGTPKAGTTKSNIESILSKRVKHGPKEVGADTSLLADSARRIHETKPGKGNIKSEESGDALEGLGGKPEVSAADRLHARMERKAVANRAATAGLGPEDEEVPF